MMNLNREAPERQDIEALLPWHAAGTLSRRDSDRVEQALASDRELARRYALVREELNETIHLNETLGAPSARAMEKLFAAIDAEAPVAKKASFNFTSRVVEFMSNFSPRTLAYAGTAAAIALMVQAAVLTAVVVRNHDTPASHTLASDPALSNQRAVVRFTVQCHPWRRDAFPGRQQGGRGARSEPRRHVRDPARHLADVGPGVHQRDPAHAGRDQYRRVHRAKELTA